MQVSPFEFEMGRPADERQEPREEARASPPPGDDDDQRGDETPEEPGYGHGV